MTRENIDKKIKLLLNELQEKTGVSEKEIINFKQILDLGDLSKEKE